MARYYDVVLALIPASLLGVATALIVAGLPMATAVPVGALVASGLIGHALFVNTPLEDTDDRPAGAQGTNQSPGINAD